MLAERGRIRRRFALESAPEYEGEPLPWEEPWVDHEDFDPEYDDADPWQGTDRMASAYAALSLDPSAVGSDTCCAATAGSP